MDADEVRSQVRECRRCHLVERPTISPVPFSGPQNPEILVIGEAPGAHENARGEPFVGPAGKLARRWLEGIGKDPKTLAFVNIVSCYPTRTPEIAEIDACRPNFVSQVEFLAPKAVLVLGGVAFGQFWANLPLRMARGLWWKAEIGSTSFWAMATWHPSYALRDEDAALAAKKDMALFRLGLETIDRGSPLGKLVCAMCGSGEIATRYREMPFCGACEPAEMVLERHFPDASWT